MGPHIAAHRKGFKRGVTEVTGEGDDTGIAFSILKMEGGDEIALSERGELALLLLEGSVRLSYGDGESLLERGSLFDEGPSALHLSAKSPLRLEALSGSECALFKTENEKRFPTTLYRPEDTEDEERGKGLLSDTSFRCVRTIFDGRNSHPDAKLVLGEVVNFPGRWSSYPPHSHPQPEIYHYRFTKECGYGHGELGEEVYKVRQYDTLKILEGKEHAQCSAPGYGMYYIWAIRHLEGNRYTVPEFNEEHRWTMVPGSAAWSAKWGNCS